MDAQLHRREFWLPVLIRLVWGGALALAVSLVAGPAWGLAAAALMLGLLVLMQLVYLERLQRWLQSGDKADVPEGWGAWSLVFSNLYRRERRERRNRERTEALLTRFRLGAEALPDAVVVLTPANRIDWCNPRAERLLGVQQGRDHAQPLTNLVRAPALDEFLRAGGAGTLAMPSPVDAQVSLALLLIPFDESNRLLIARDITAERRLDVMRRDFIANVSHELKTPLAVVSGFIEHLQDADLDDETQQRIVGLMSEQAQRMTRLTEDLLALSQLESDEAPPVRERIDMARLLADLAAEARTLASGRLHVQASAATQALAGSTRELHSAFANLVGNAVRYTPPGGRVSLTWRIMEDGSGAFEVEDNGIGIAPEHIPRLTERFYRVDPGRSRDNLIGGGGTGLGLAIVKHVLLRHSARLTIRSSLGEGSVFSAVFPAERVNA
jgi:two-component system phosphate regulon sensor histidine kinase PhoR